MGCSVTLTGISTTCAGQRGGIKIAYAVNKSDITSITTASSKITTITLATGVHLTPFEFRKNTGSLTSTYTIDDTTGVKFVTSALALQFSKMETTKRIAFQALVEGETAIVVEDCNGSKWFLGFDNPVTATEATAQTGAAGGDLNGYNITLTDESNELPYELNLSDADWAALLA